MEQEDAGSRAQAHAAALVAGDRTAFAAVFRILAPALSCFLRKYVADDDVADDLAQEAFVRLWENRAGLDTGRSLRNYLFTIALNLHRDRARRAGRARTVSLTVLEGAGVQTADARADHARALADRELVGRVQALVAALPDRERAALVMKKVNGMTFGEIAAVTGESDRHVKRRVQKALDTLLRELGRQGYGKEGIALWAII